MAASDKGQRTRRAHGDPAEAPAAGLAVMVSGLLEETALWQAFLGTHRRLVDRLADQMQTDHGLPLEWFDVLIHLADVPGARLRQRELRDRMLLSESGVSRMLARMAASGLVERRPADDDRRGVEIVLTEAGAQALAVALESHRELVATSFTDRLTATDRLALEHILAKLSDPAEGS
jgi:DNA-binding MarR family transcriptional regulator